MFVLSHFFGPLIGLGLTAFLLTLGFPPDKRMAGFSALVCLFWLYPAALRLGSDYRLLSFLSLEHLTVTILWASHSYGGLTSPFLLWLAVVPLLAFLYLAPERRTWVILVSMLAGNLGLFAFVTTAFPAAPADPRALRWLSAVSLVGAFAYVSMMAVYFGRLLSSRDEMALEAERHRAIAAVLDRRVTELRRERTAKSASLARLVRECRPPLREITASCGQIVDEEGAALGTDGSDLQSIDGAARHLGEVIGLIDRFLASEASYGRPVPTMFSIGELLGSTVVRAGEAGAKDIAWRGSNELLQTMLQSDKELMEEALLLLIEHLRQIHGTEVEIVLRAEPGPGEGEKCIIIGTDGPASEEQVPQGSKPAAPSPERPTVGIRLALAARIVETLHGSVTACSDGTGRTAFGLVPTCAETEASAGQS